MLKPPGHFGQFDRDRELLNTLNKRFLNETTDEAAIQGRNEFQRKALDMLRSAKLRRALEIDREDARTFDRYGITRLPKSPEWQARNVGRRLLAVRRLIEAGVPYVETDILSWDWHISNYFQEIGMSIPVFDMVLASLIEDLDERGFLERTIVLAFGEMGRTPTIGRNGRDHWYTSQFVFAAGGGFRAEPPSAPRTRSAPAPSIVTRSKAWAEPFTPSWASIPTRNCATRTDGR